MFFGQLLCKMRVFSDKNHVKFGNFVNFSGKYNKNSGILIILFGQESCKIRAFCWFLIHIFRAKMLCPPKDLTELLRLCSKCQYNGLILHPPVFYSLIVTVWCKEEGNSKFWVQRRITREPNDSLLLWHVRQRYVRYEKYHDWTVVKPWFGLPYGRWTIRKNHGASMIFFSKFRFPAIFDCSFEWGSRTPNLGEGEAVWGRG